jgi:ribosome-associated protein
LATKKVTTTTAKRVAAKKRAVKKAASKMAAVKAARPLRKRIVSAPAEIDTPWLLAVRAAESKKATDIRVLDLRPVTTFADTFVICSGTNSRQIQAIADEIERQLKQELGERPNSVEGYQNSEWVLLDYGDFVIHVFSEKARSFYDLERLWRDAHEIRIPEAS